MPTVLITTPGSASANSYAEYTDYQAYWGARGFNTAQLAATQELVEASMLWATRMLDLMFRWTGHATDDVQALAWPRKSMLTKNGFVMGETVIPVELKNAECEWAGILLSGDRTADDPSLSVIGPEAGLTSVKAGSVALTWSDSRFNSIEDFDAFVRSLGSDFAYLSKAVPESVRLMLPPSWYTQTQLRRKILFGAY